RAAISWAACIASWAFRVSLSNLGISQSSHFRGATKRASRIGRPPVTSCDFSSALLESRGEIGPTGLSYSRSQPPEASRNLRILAQADNKICACYCQVCLWIHSEWHHPSYSF